MRFCAHFIYLIGVWIGKVASQNYLFGLPRFEEHLTCRGSRMHKLMMNQTGYIQFVYYDVDVPDLTSFHTCFWFNLMDPHRAATFVSYARDFEVETNLLTIQWTGGPKPRWTLEINDELIVDAPANIVFADTWHHACITWDGNINEYGIFQDGLLIEAKAYYEPKLRIIRGGGILTSGQHQENRPTGMDQKEGLEGWLTLFHFDTRPIGKINSSTIRLITRLSSDCRARSRGNLVDWLHSPRKGYGGVTEYPAIESCQNF